MPRAVLFTQCLQNDFVKPLGRYDALPNRLHIGFSEARRLLGENPSESPVSRVMEWAYSQPPEELRIVHIRDWHDASDPRQATHLRIFGPHCLRDGGGAELAFPVPDPGRAGIVDLRSPGLNDFHETGLAEVLAPLAEEPLVAGILGVWTEAKVTFLAYELCTRYPSFRVVVCSALTASSSRAQHFVALDQLRRILGVHVCDAVGEFIELLGGTAREYPLTGLADGRPAVELEAGATLPPTDDQLLRYLFRDCRKVRGRVLDGGFSGNVVLGTRSVDLHGHEQAAHVVKIGPRNPIGQERSSFERIEEVLGNSAPRITDFADFADRGAIKYRYASMGAGSATTFQKRYAQGMPLEKVREVLRTVFVEQLGRLYAAAELEACNLLQYYAFESRWAPGVRRRVEAILGRPADGATLRLERGPPFANLCRFYETELDRLDPLRGDVAWFAYVHGDLNGANIILDAHENVWLIDFFHTHRGHVLRDLIKLENDLLYIFTPIAGEDALEEAIRLTDALVDLEDLGAPLREEVPEGVRLPELQRAWQTVGILRSFYPDLIRSDRGSFQWLVAAMRYAVHTLSFDESSAWQKRWALYTASRCGERIVQTLSGQGPIRIDGVVAAGVPAGRLGITILPGRKDWGRRLDRDLDAIRRGGVTDVLCLVPAPELAEYGVPDLIEAYARRGLAARHLPILDQKTCSLEEMRDAIRWMAERIAGGGRVLVHCVGGLGRSGLVVACFLRSLGMSAAAAVEAVRAARSPRAIESAAQEQFVEEFRADG